MGCGDGHELDLAGGIPGPMAAHIPQLSFEFCQMFFANLPNDAFCLKTKFDSGSEQWCYVSTECQDGNHPWGSDKPNKLKSKMCGPGDKNLGDMTFEQFTD